MPTTLTEPKPRHYSQPTRAARLKEARENALYWKRQQALRTQPAARAQAGALRLAWEQTVAALSSES